MGTALAAMASQPSISHACRLVWAKKETRPGVRPCLRGGVWKEERITFSDRKCTSCATLNKNFYNIYSYLFGGVLNFYVKSDIPAETAQQSKHA
jgi:hypothetical protein